MFDKKTVNRMQFFNYDNGDVEFRRLPIVGQSATKLDETGDPEASWIDFFQTLYPFDGYKTIPGDAVQLAYSRHFHMEVHDILPVDIRPPDNDAMDSQYITKIAESRAIQIAKAVKPKTIYDKLTTILGAALIMEFVLWGIQIATR